MKQLWNVPTQLHNDIGNTRMFKVGQWNYSYDLDLNCIDFVFLFDWIHGIFSKKNHWKHWKIFFYIFVDIFEIKKLHKHTCLISNVIHKIKKYIWNSCFHNTL